MKKYAITAIIIIAIISLFAIIRITTNDTEQSSGTGSASVITQPEMQISTQQESSIESIYESNMQIVKSYMEAVYNRSNDDNKDLKQELKDILSQDMLGKYTKTDSDVTEGHTFETRLKHPTYTANQDTVIVLYTLKTRTEANENDQDRLLVAEVENGKIKAIRKDTALP